MSNGALTLQQIQNSFNQFIAMQNPDINPSVRGTDWWAYGFALSGIASGIYQDQQNISNAIFTQFEQGLFLDYRAFSMGQPPRRGEVFATVIATLEPTPSGSIIFPVGTIFSTTFNNQNYVLIATATTSTSTTIEISLQCALSGSGLSLPTGTILTNLLFSLLNATVVSSTDGQASETDGQLRARLLFASQNPQGGGREGQYTTWALASDSNVTGVIVVPPPLPGSLQIGVFDLAGGEDYDSLLLTGTPYNRTATPATILNSNIYINAQRPLDADVFVSSVSLFQPSLLVTDPDTYQITVEVSLVNSLTLSSLVTNIDGNPITVENMILQELRRGFITYPFQGTQIGDILTPTFYILISRLEQVLDSSLSVNGGIYQQILTDRNITIDDGLPVLTGIQVPHDVKDSNDNLICVYDLITYDSGGTIIPTPGLLPPIITLV